MKNTSSKIIIIVVALAIAVCGVLYFVQTIVSPPEGIKKGYDHTSDIQRFVNSYNPDSENIHDAVDDFDAIVDRADVYMEDSFIEQETYNEAISNAAEKLASSFTGWAMPKFNQSSWANTDHTYMRWVIKKLRNVAQVNAEALSAKSLQSISKVENILDDYGRAWAATRQTDFTSYLEAKEKRIAAESYAKKAYLRNCTALVNSLSSVGASLELSRYEQLDEKVGKLSNQYLYNTDDSFNTESRRIDELINEFSNTDAFGASSSESKKNHVRILRDHIDRIKNSRR